MLVSDETLQTGEWASRQLGQRFVPPFVAIGIRNKQGELTGAAIFNDRCDRNIEMTAVGRGAFTRGVCRELARYCFVQSKCRRVTTRTRASNLYVRRVLERFGWVEEGVLRHWYDDDDCVVYGLLKKDCRFLG